MLTDLQIARYSRQIILPAVGGRGQQQLLSTAVAVAGSAAMACAAGLYLAAAGVGRLCLIGCARDVRDDLETVNPDCHVTCSESPSAGHDAAQIVSQSDIVVCADTCADTAALLNAQCLAWHRPLAVGCVNGAFGHVALLGGSLQGGACYQCLRQNAAPEDCSWPDPAPNGSPGASAQAALSGAVGAFIGSVLATEVIKLTLGLEPTLKGRRLVYDAVNVTMSETNIIRVPHCVACGATGPAETSA